MPYSYLSIFVEAYHGMINQKSPEMRIQLMEADKRLAQNINTLLMSKATSINESERNILNKY